MAHATQVKTVTKNYRSAINDMHNGKKEQRSVHTTTAINPFTRKFLRKYYTTSRVRLHRGNRNKKSSDTSPNKSDNNSDNIIFYSSDQEDTGITTEYKI